MSNQSNFSPLVINVDGISSRTAAIKWLAAQSKEVRAVTSVTESGGLQQFPVIEDGAYVDPTARLIGGMIIRTGCYVGPFAVVRLDEKSSSMPLIVGPDTNIQDCAVVHSSTQTIGKGVIVAHQAVVHGAVLEDGAAVYIQAVIDGGGTVIGRGTFCHQGSYVGKGLRIGENRYVEPGRKILTQSEADALPPVTDALRDLKAHVLDLNRSHVKRYLDCARLHA